MPPKKRKTTTDATKAKLPLPANHPQKRVKKRKPKGDEGFHPIGTPKFDAEKAREFNAPRAIPCGEDTQTATGAHGVWQVSRDNWSLNPEPWVAEALKVNAEVRVVGKVYYRAKVHVPADFVEARKARLDAFLKGERDRIIAYENAHLQPPPPDTSAYPWPLRFVTWVDGKLAAAQRWLATRLRLLADAVEGTP